MALRKTRLPLARAFLTRSEPVTTSKTRTQRPKETANASATSPLSPNHKINNSTGKSIIYTASSHELVSTTDHHDGSFATWPNAAPTLPASTTTTPSRLIHRIMQ